MYKTKLQELCQQKAWGLPEYGSSKEGPDHNPRFKATVTVNGQPFHSQNACKSSKEAQNDAASLAFHHFTNPNPTPTPTPTPIPIRLPCKVDQNDAASLALHHFTNPILSSFAPFPQPSFPSSSVVSSDLDSAVDIRFDMKRPKIQEETNRAPPQDKSTVLGSSTVSSDLDSVVDIRFNMKRPKIQEETNQAPPWGNATVLYRQHLYKNQLQTYAQKRNLSLPMYSCEREGPSHASRFKCKVTIDGQTYESPQFFSTLKDAEHAVARVALMSLSPDGIKEDDSGFYKNLLQELVQKEGFRLPVYGTNRSGEVHAPHFVSTVEIEGEVFTGEGARSKKQAELNAAKVAYMTLKERSSIGSGDLDGVVDIRWEMQQPMIQEETNQAPPQSNAIVLDTQHLYKNQLQNYAQKRNLGLPVYSCEREGPSHASRFKCKVTIDGQSYESPQFFSTLKDAEHAIARVALMSLSPDGVKEDDSGFYKNLLQELVQKEGFRLPVYETNRSGEVHVPHFVSTVEIEGEVFTGEGARTKKQAELSAAKVAYTTLKERKSSQNPLILCPARLGQEVPASSSRLQPIVTADLQQNVPKILKPHTVTERQAQEDRVNAEVCRYHPTRIYSGPDSIKTINKAPSSSGTVYGCVQETFVSAASSASDCSTTLVKDSSVLQPTGMSNSSCTRVSVHPRMSNMTIPKGSTKLPISDENWIAFSHPN